MMKEAKSLNKYEPWTVGLGGHMGFLLCAQTAPMPHGLQAQLREGPGVVVLGVHKMGTRVSCKWTGLGHM